jgi:site-specific recombinase XerD
MDCPASDRLVRVLSFLTSPVNQQHVLRYLMTLEARNYAASTVLAVVHSIKCLTTHLPTARQSVLLADLTQTTAQDISAFVSGAQQAGLKASTVNGKLSLLSEFFAFLCADELMRCQPVVRRRHRLLTHTTLPKPMRAVDVTAFFKVIDSVRDRLLFLIMLRCGLRVSEVCALRWDDLDWEDNTFRINNGKGQVDRIVYFSTDVAQTLQTWQACPQKNAYIFPSREGQDVSLQRTQVNRLMKDYLTTANITKPYSPHCLRHTFATELLNAGVPLEVLKELLGHKALHVTLRYTQLYEGNKRQQYEQAMHKLEQRQAAQGGA